MLSYYSSCLMGFELISGVKGVRGVISPQAGLGVKADSYATHKQRESINRSIGFNSL